MVDRYADGRQARRVVGDTAFMHNVCAYRTLDDLSPAQALRKFLEKDPVIVLKEADPDLRRWLPTVLWDKMHPRVTAEMVAYVRGALGIVADAIEKNVMDGSLKYVQR